MPIYEYRCPKCGEFEQMQRITEPPLQRCPQCRKKVTKLMSNTSFQLKGGGWYVTDYAKKGSGDKGDKGEKSDSKETKSEKKDSAKKTSPASKTSAAA
jgi:putative FmdB family regulatory protein